MTVKARYRNPKCKVIVQHILDDQFEQAYQTIVKNRKGKPVDLVLTTSQVMGLLLSQKDVDQEFLLDQIASFMNHVSAKYLGNRQMINLPMPFEEMKAKALENDLCDTWADVLKNAQCVEDMPKEKISELAYRWARKLGDHDLMRPLVTDSFWAYQWARFIGDREQMINLVTDSRTAYLWAVYIGDHDVMRPLIKEPIHAYWWAMYVGDHEEMINLVTDSDAAYQWALNIGDHNIMRDRVTDPVLIGKWIANIGDRDLMIDRLKQQA